MSLSSAIITALMDAGATREQLAAAMMADIAEREAEATAKLEAKRAGNRERQRRKRNGQSRNVTPVTRDKCDTPPDGSPKENNQTPSLPPAEVSEANASSPQPWALPVGVSLRVWTDLMTNRKRKRLPNTETAWKGFLDDLSRVSIETGIPPPKLIERCTAKGWGAIYDPRDNRHERTDTNPTGTALRRVQDALRGGSPFG